MSAESQNFGNQSQRLDQIRGTLVAWQEAPCTGGYPTMPVWPGKHGGCVFCDQKIASEAADFMDRIARPMIVCPECGNKRCPKAQWHRNKCTRSNDTDQPYDYPAAPPPADLAYLLAEVERLRAKNAELNRRCTKAERFFGKGIEELRAKGPVTFGRALANLAAETEHRRVEELEREVERLEREVAVLRAMKVQSPPRTPVRFSTRTNQVNTKEAP